jgi:hypothetical protein
VGVELFRERQGRIEMDLGSLVKTGGRPPARGRALLCARLSGHTVGSAQRCQGVCRVPRSERRAHWNGQSWFGVQDVCGSADDLFRSTICECERTFAGPRPQQTEIRPGLVQFPPAVFPRFLNGGRLKRTPLLRES